MQTDRIINSINKGKWQFLVMLFLLALSVIIERKTNNRLYDENDTRRFQSVLNSKENRIDNILNDLTERKDSFYNREFFTGLLSPYTGLLEREGMGIFIYLEDSLICWSDNSIPISLLLMDVPPGNFIRISNDYYLRKEKKEGKFSVIGLILLKKDYPYENRFLRSGFPEEYRLSKNIFLVGKGGDSDVHSVYDKNGNYIFSLDYSMSRKWNEKERILSIILYSITFILFLAFLKRITKNLIRRYNNYLFLLQVLILLLIFLFFHFYRLPDILFRLNLFSPEKFARSNLLPSLGDLFLLSLIVLFLAYNFYVDVELKSRKLRSSSWLRLALLLVIAVFILFWYRFTFTITKSLILDSTISFQVFKVPEITVHTFIGFLILGFLFLTLILMMDKVLLMLKTIHKKNDALLFIIFLNANAFALLILSVNPVPPEGAVFFLLAGSLLYYQRFRPDPVFRFTAYIAFVHLFASFLVF